MTKLERANPALIALARTVDPHTKIYHRAGAYWLGDLQLTYDRDVTDGRNIALDWPAQVALAEHILRRVLDALADPAWGGLWERQRRVLIGLREDVCPSFRRGMFCHWRHPSLDDGCLVARSLGRGYTAYVNIVGEPQHEADAATLEGVIEALWIQLAPKGERPSWHGSAPPDLRMIRGGNTT